jgi:ribosomal protein S17E
MGRIKQTYLKRVAEKLLEEYEEVFTTTDFEDNKKKVGRHTDIKSKSIRNITRAINQKNKAAD